LWGANDNDNTVNYAWSAADIGWLIQSADLPNGGVQSLAAGTPAFDFVFIPVPEPTSLGTLAIGGLALLARRRRQH